MVNAPDMEEPQGDRGKRYGSSEVVCNENPNGSRVIQEIRFAGSSEIIVFNEWDRPIQSRRRKDGSGLQRQARLPTQEKPYRHGSRAKIAFPVGSAAPPR
jgi:hypothetical protein